MTFIEIGKREPWFGDVRPVVSARFEMTGEIWDKCTSTYLEEKIS